mgnify:CR=1 FL=1
MSKEIYEKNIEKIGRKFKSWADFIEEKEYTQSNYVRVESDTAIDGTSILRVSNAGKIMYLNGKYNPSHAGKDWLESIGEIEDFATVIIVGIGDGIHIRNILEKAKPSTNILIYEPSIEVFLKALEEVDLTFLFEDNIPIGIVVEGINEKELEIYFNKMISYDSMTMLKVYISGNYEKIFSDKVAAFVDKLKKYIRDIEKNWNTIVRYTTVNANNIFHNCKYMYDGYSVEALAGILPSDLPTIVVSAGPSLNKNIEDLKLAQGKANIIATDTAMKPLLNAGIMPDFFVVVDGLKPGDLFKHKDISKVPMVTMNAISVEPMEIHKGRKFFYASDSMIETELMSRITKIDSEAMNIPVLPSGGSVATSAYTLGAYMGSRTIILVGQDLAMTGNKTHADGTFKDKMDDIDVNSGEYFETESIDGGKVLTRMDFKLYLEWFEDQIKRNPWLRVIDATEGGAKIHGSEIMTLKEAIEQNCKKKFNVRYKVARLPRMMGEKGRDEFLKVLEEMPSRLVEVKKKAGTGIRQYEKLEKLSKNKNYNADELKKLLKQIGKTNRFIETDYMACIVNDSLKGVEYALRTSIYDKREEATDEMYEIAQNGKLMLQAEKYAADELLELTETTTSLFAKKQRAKKKAGKK